LDCNRAIQTAQKIQCQESMEKKGCETLVEKLIKHFVVENIQ